MPVAEGTAEAIDQKSYLPQYLLHELMFLGPYGVGIDRRGGKLGMAEPLLHQIEGDTGG